MLNTFLLLPLVLVAQAAFAEAGTDYSQIFSCSAPGGVVRFDRYLGYGNGSSTGAPLRPRMQVVLMGEPVSVLGNAGFYPYKESSVPGEFIIDELEERSPGPILVARSEFGARPSVLGIALNREEETLVITEYHGYVSTSVTLTGIVCSE